MVKLEVGMMIGLEDLWLAFGKADGGYDDWACEIPEPGFLANYANNGVTQNYPVIFG